jgi:hypothetical protein
MRISFTVEEIMAFNLSPEALTKIMMDRDQTHQVEKASLEQRITALENSDVAKGLEIKELKNTVREQGEAIKMESIEQDIKNR